MDLDFGRPCRCPQDDHTCEQNDLNKSSPKTAEKRVGNAEFMGEGNDKSFGSETESDSPQNIVIIGKGITASSDPSQISQFPEIPCDFSGDLPGYLLCLQTRDSKLKIFRSYNELSEYLVDATSDGNERNPETDLVVADILNTSLKHIAHHTTMGEYLKYIYANDLLMDVRVDVNGEIFLAHRMALCCHSNYLAELFYKSKRRRLPFDLKLKGVSPESFAAFLEFVYTGEVIIVPSIASDLLLIADFLRVRALQRKRSMIIDNLPLEQMVGFISRSNGSVSPQTQESFIRNLLERFSDAVQTKYFFDIDLETLCRLLASDDLVVRSEFEVFKTVIEWILFDLSQRTAYTERLLKLVRYCYMSQEELFNCVEMTSLVRDNERLRNHFTNANWIWTSRILRRPEPFQLQIPPPRNCYKFIVRLTPKLPSPNFNIPPAATPPSTPTNKHFSMPSPLMTSTPNASPKKVEQKQVSKPIAKPVTKPVAKPVLIPNNMQKMASPIPKSVDILVIGGFQTENDAKPDLGASPKDQWVHYCQLPEPMQNHAVTLLSGKLYLIGGSIPANEGFNQLPTRRVFVMDIGDKQWKRMADMIEARYNHCACALNGRIYAIGGRGVNNRTLASVECYSPKADMWCYVSFMHTPRYAAAAACLSGTIFVVGGMGESPVSDVETFNPTTNKWTLRNNLRFARSNAALVNVGERLFLCGGVTRTKDSTLTSVADIDEYLESEDVWGHRTNITIPRHDAGVAVAGPRIYIIGGVSTTANKVLQSIECYDTRACAWLTGLKDLPMASRHIRCASVVSEWGKVNSPNGNISL